VSSIRPIQEGGSKNFWFIAKNDKERLKILRDKSPGPKNSVILEASYKPSMNVVAGKLMIVKPSKCVVTKA